MFLIPDDSYEIRTTKDKGRGVFATKEIESGTVIGDYIGVVQQAENYHNPHNDTVYTVLLNDDYLVEPNPASNGIHLINHSCAPTCDMAVFQGHVLCIALRHIFPGEELTMMYYLSPPNEEDCNPCHHGCKCESVHCQGTWHLPEAVDSEMYAFFSQDPKYTPNIAAQLGKTLAPLDHYPCTLLNEVFADAFACADQKPITYPDTTLPATLELKKRLRETGRQLHFPHIGVTIIGVLRGHPVLA